MVADQLVCWRIISLRILRACGTRSENPMKSVKKPGVIRSAPAATIQNPSKISLSGICPDSAFLRIEKRVCNPWCLTSPPPMIAVKKARLSVVHIPICSLTVANRNSSINGIMIKIAKNGMVFI